MKPAIILALSCFMQGQASVGTLPPPPDGVKATVKKADVKKPKTTQTQPTLAQAARKPKKSLWDRLHKKKDAAK